MDPVPTQSYLHRVIIPEAIDAAMGGAHFDGLVEQFAGLLTQQAMITGRTDGALAALGAAQVMHQAQPLPGVTTRNFTAVTLNAGDTLLGDVGTTFILMEGSTFVSGGAGILDASTGAEVRPNAFVQAGNRHVVLASGGSGLTATSVTARVLVRGWRTVRPAYQPIFTAYADRLNSWNLFRGTNIGYELNRPATRIEGLILLVRLLGEEDGALAFPPHHIYPDVPHWADQQADRFVAYGLHRGFTRGSTRDGQPHFGASDLITADMYATFLLRALGYDDAAGDFVWSSALDFAAGIGLVPHDHVRGMRTVFMRDHVVYLSYRALFLPIRGTHETLGMRLGLPSIP
jgi:hypothetical protein